MCRAKSSWRVARLLADPLFLTAGRAVVARRDILSFEMKDRRALRGLPLAGMAIVGVVLGHWLSYLLAIPDAHLRAEVLAQSGHGYWMVAVKAAVVFGCVGVGTLLFRHLNAHMRGEPSVEDRPAAVALRLALLQVAAFVAMEAVERSVAGEPVSQVFRHHIFLFGVALQVAVACLGTFVLLWFNRLAAKVCLAIAAPRFDRSATVQAAPAVVVPLPLRLLRGGTGLRSPPSH
jgi:hypothetical protein